MRTVGAFKEEFVCESGEACVAWLVSQKKKSLSDLWFVASIRGKVTRPNIAKGTLTS
jgi:hypothetical protein